MADNALYALNVFLLGFHISQISLPTKAQNPLAPIQNNENQKKAP